MANNSFFVSDMTTIEVEQWNLTELAIDVVHEGVVGPPVLTSFDAIAVVKAWWNPSDDVTLKVWTSCWICRKN